MFSDVCPARTTAWICNWLMFVCQATLAQNPMLTKVGFFCLIKNFTAGLEHPDLHREGHWFEPSISLKADEFGLFIYDDLV